MKSSRTITADLQEDNTFILFINGEPTYRTSEMSSDEVEEAEYNTSADWEQFLKTGSYRKV